MGYVSVVKVKAAISVESGDNEVEAEEITELRARAQAFGYAVAPINKVASPAEVIEQWLKDNYSLGLGFFVQLDADDLSLRSSGESGKCYELVRDISTFIDFLKGEALELNGTFWREGEGVGELQRVVVSHNAIISDEEAKLVFADGTEYNQ